MPDSWSDALQFLPSTAAAAFTTVEPTEHQLAPWTGAPVSTACIIAAVSAAARALVRRDA